MPSAIRKEPVEYRKDIAAILLFAAAIFITICLVSYNPADPAFNSASNVAHIKNMGGIIGAYLADILFTVFGISAYALAALLFLMSSLKLLRKRLRLRVHEAIFYVFLLISVSALIHLRLETIDVHGHAIAGGGIIGGLIGEILTHYLNPMGAALILSAATLLFFMLSTHITLVDIGNASFVAGKWLYGFAIKASGLIWAYSKAGAKKSRLGVQVFIRLSKQILTRNEQAGPVIGTDHNEAVHIDPLPGTLATNTRLPAHNIADAVGPKIINRTGIRPRHKGDEQLKFLQMNMAGYTPPPLALLDSPERQAAKIDEDALKKQSLYLEKKLMDFGVEGHVTAIRPGPVITMYEFEPSIGTKINQITNLEDDLSLALGGRSVRVLSHIPGKAAVGVEVPNRDREFVYLKDIISSSQFAKSASKLSLALGVSTDGRPMVTDLAKMPHLLVAGATGAGKSVAIHSMIVSILYKSTPEDIRFILVDPKMLELTSYNGIPHLLLPVVTKPKETILAMRWAVREMERRYRLLSSCSARDIAGYNEKIRSKELPIISHEEAQKLLTENKEAITHTGVLPCIVIIIDELADLMMTVTQEMEETITRLAQMARAAGIHLILATQRPSVDVITGLIKANFPARMAFKTTARHDSRTILDTIGSETLLGAGDMLFMTPSGGTLTRIHGALVTEPEIARIVEHLKQQGVPHYDDTILTASQGTNGTIEDFDDMDEEVYDKAVALVAETKQASISMIQRRMRIGYNRAARMIERMEAEGIVGPADGSRPREVLTGNYKSLNHG